MLTIHPASAIKNIRRRFYCFANHAELSHTPFQRLWLRESQSLMCFWLNNSDKKLLKCLVSLINRNKCQSLGELRFCHHVADFSTQGFLKISLIHRRSIHSLAILLPISIVTANLVRSGWIFLRKFALVSIMLAYSELSKNLLMGVVAELGSPHNSCKNIG